MTETRRVHILRASESHIPAIVKLWKEFIDFHKDIDPFYTISKEGPARFAEYIREHLEKDDSLILVGLLGDDVVSYSIARVLKRPPVFDGGEYGDIVDLAVTSALRRKGIGEQMLDFMLEWFRSRGLSRVELRVAAGNQIGNTFWRKQGFQEFTSTLYREFGQEPRGTGLDNRKG
jgi:ribosomal protein S18 acetylase RimI-like enzyme